MFGRLNSNKLKTQCQLGISRIKLMRNKKQLALKQTRKDVAELLRASKEGNARIRVETVIRETLMLQAYDILELFLELLAVRVQLLEKTKQIPPDMLEALSSIVCASANISDIPELPNIRGILGSKFGKEFVQGASSLETSRMWHVNENLLRCLAIGAPEPDEKLQTLSEIAQEFGVEWNAAAAAQDILPPTALPPNVPVVGGELPDIEARTALPPPPLARPPPGAVLGAGVAPSITGATRRSAATPASDGPPLGSGGSGELRTQLFGADAAPPASNAAPYADASAAAAAARVYSKQAQMAADAAEELARKGGPVSPPKTYEARTPADIQRDYDAVPPVVKPPSAPAVPPAAPAPEPKAPAPNAANSSDLDDLTRRLDALKRGK